MQCEVLYYSVSFRVLLNRWDDVAGLTEAKQALYESVLLPLQRPGCLPVPFFIYLFPPCSSCTRYSRLKNLASYHWATLPSALQIQKCVNFQSLTDWVVEEHFQSRKKTVGNCHHAVRFQNLPSCSSIHKHASAIPLVWPWGTSSPSHTVLIPHLKKLLSFWPQMSSR